MTRRVNERRDTEGLTNLLIGVSWTWASARGWRGAWCDGMAHSVASQTDHLPPVQHLIATLPHPPPSWEKGRLRGPKEGRL